MAFIRCFYVLFVWGLQAKFAHTECHFSIYWQFSAVRDIFYAVEHSKMWDFPGKYYSVVCRECDKDEITKTL